jgi:hypothetical protein
MHARYGISAAARFAPLRSGVWWWVITHHQSFNFQTDLDMAEKKACYTHTSSTPQQHMAQAGARLAFNGSQ